MENLIRETLDQGIIKPSHSPFLSLVLLAHKKDTTFRFCVKYHVLNVVTIKDKFSISTIDEFLDQLGGTTISNKLDLRVSYHWIHVHSRDTYKMMVQTHEGHYEFLIMPFSLTNDIIDLPSYNEPNFFYLLMQVYHCTFDDILVQNANAFDHVLHLE